MGEVDKQPVKTSTPPANADKVIVPSAENKGDQPDKETVSPPSVGEKLAETVAQRKALERMERMEEYGAMSQTPKGDLLDARVMEDADPDHYYKYVRMDEGKMATARDAHQMEAVPSDECEKAGVKTQVGDLRLMRGPMTAHLRRVELRKKEHVRRHQQHKGEVEKVAESLAKELRDRHGSDITAEQLLRGAV